MSNISDDKAGDILFSAANDIAISLADMAKIRLKCDNMVASIKFANEKVFNTINTYIFDYIKQCKGNTRVSREHIESIYNRRIDDFLRIENTMLEFINNIEIMRYENKLPLNEIDHIFIIKSNEINTFCRSEIGIIKMYIDFHRYTNNIANTNTENKENTMKKENNKRKSIEREELKEHCEETETEEETQFKKEVLKAFVKTKSHRRFYYNCDCGKRFLTTDNLTKHLQTCKK